MTSVKESFAEHGHSTLNVISKEQVSEPLARLQFLSILQASAVTLLNSMPPVLGNTCQTLTDCFQKNPKFAGPFVNFNGRVPCGNDKARLSIWPIQYPQSVSLCHCVVSPRSSAIFQSHSAPQFSRPWKGMDKSKTSM